MLAALALAALQGDLTPLERHAREAERIVAGRVERIHEVSQSPPRAAAWPAGTVLVAEVVVTRVLLGDPERERVFVLAARPAEGGVAPLLAVGHAGELTGAQAVWDAERFRAHPAQLGSMARPDDSWLIVRMRTRGGVARLEVHPSHGRAEPEAVATARAHVLAILAALPGDPGPALRLAR